jgi:hypothetical protein
MPGDYREYDGKMCAAAATKQRIVSRKCDSHVGPDLCYRSFCLLHSNPL